MKISEGQHEGRYIFKVNFLGVRGVGKTALLERTIGNRFDDDYRIRIGNAFHQLIYPEPYREYQVSLFLWDRPGESWGPIRPSLVTNSNLLVFVYDITDESSFSSIYQQIEDLERYFKKMPPVIVIANKSDLQESSLVEPLNGQIISEQISKRYDVDTSFLHVSAKSKENLDIFRKTMLRALLDDLLKGHKEFDTKQAILQKGWNYVLDFLSFHSPQMILQYLGFGNYEGIDFTVDDLRMVISDDFGFEKGIDVIRMYLENKLEGDIENSDWCQIDIDFLKATQAARLIPSILEKRRLEITALCKKKATSGNIELVDLWNTFYGRLMIANKYHIPSSHEVSDILGNISSSIL